MSDNNVYIPSSALDSFSNALYAERLQDIGTREPYFMIGINLNKNNPQYSAVTAKCTHFIRGEEKNKAFEVKTKMQYVKAALMQMIEYSHKPFDNKRELMVWEVKAPKIQNGKMTQEKVTSGKLVVGRTEKGVFISVVHWNDKFPQIAFYPGLYDQNAVVNPSAEDAERSYNFVCATARGWATTISDLLATEWSEGQNAILKALRANQNQNGGGYNGGSNGGSNYNNSGNKNYGGNSGGYAGGFNPNQTVETSTSNGDEFNF